jgi:hypothetical protein
MGKVTSGLGLEGLEDDLLVVYLLEYIFKPPIVFLQDGVLGGQKLSETINVYHQRRRMFSQPTSGIFLDNAILNDECAKPEIDYPRVESS